jgi:hypothetical protein
LLPNFLHVLKTCGPFRYIKTKTQLTVTIYVSAKLRDFFDKTRSMWRDDDADIDETEDIGPMDSDK